MQIGMIRLRRMSASTVRRSIAKGRDCVAVSTHYKSVAALGKDGKIGAFSLDDRVAKLAKKSVLCMTVSDPLRHTFGGHVGKAAAEAGTK